MLELENIMEFNITALRVQDILVNLTRNEHRVVIILLNCSNLILCKNCNIISFTNL